MNMRELENIRYAETRGKILIVLAEDYTTSMTSTGTLVSALDLSGFSISPESLRFHLTYLEAQGYVKLWRSMDMPGYRRDRLEGRAHPEDIRFAKLMPPGLQLVDGKRVEDPMVSF